jgi:hypothetical protein
MIAFVTVVLFLAVSDSWWHTEKTTEKFSHQNAND